jgi:hypothetical protein
VKCLEEMQRLDNWESFSLIVLESALVLKQHERLSGVLHSFSLVCFDDGK